MNFLDKDLRSFLLHESSIKSIDCEKGQIILNFNKGFYNENHIQQTNCKTIIKIKHLEMSNIDCFMSVLELGKTIKKSRNFSRLQKMLKKCECYIESEYYSEFERALLIVGYINYKLIYIKITDIDMILFECE